MFEGYLYRHWGCVTARQIARIFNLGKPSGHTKLKPEDRKKVNDALERGWVAEEDWVGPGNARDGVAKWRLKAWEERQGPAGDLTGDQAANNIQQEDDDSTAEESEDGDRADSKDQGLKKKAVLKPQAKVAGAKGARGGKKAATGGATTNRTKTVEALQQPENPQPRSTTGRITASRTKTAEASQHPDNPQSKPATSRVTTSRTKTTEASQQPDNLQSKSTTSRVTTSRTKTAEASQQPDNSQPKSTTGKITATRTKTAEASQKPDDPQLKPATGKAAPKRTKREFAPAVSPEVPRPEPFRRMTRNSRKAMEGCEELDASAQQLENEVRGLKI